MQISLLLMEEIAKLFAIMLMGYAVVKAGLMKSSESKSISVVMVYLVIPCVILNAFQVEYLQLAKEGRYEDALALIKKDNPLPAVCGHVCNRRCEDACTRGTIDEAVAIDEVKRFIAERDLNAETRFIPNKIDNDNLREETLSAISKNIILSKKESIE